MAYYAVCNANGPISVRLDASDEGAAHRAFEALDQRSAIDNACTDLEDELGICGEGMSGGEFDDALRAAGATHVALLEDHNTDDAWNLWSVEA